MMASISVFMGYIFYHSMLLWDTCGCLIYRFAYLLYTIYHVTAMRHCDIQQVDAMEVDGETAQKRGPSQAEEDDDDVRSHL
jgi:hypothetical protein